MSTREYSLLRVASLILLTFAAVVGATGCASVGSSRNVSQTPSASKVTEHYHTPWRYVHMRHRHIRPVVGARSAGLPECSSCQVATDGARNEG